MKPGTLAIAVPRSQNAKIGEAEAIRLYGDQVRAYARGTRFYLPGAEIEDLEQEALIGLLHACRYYKPELGVPFWPGFALMCVRRWLTWTLRRDNHVRHQSLTKALRCGVGEDGTEVRIAELLPDPRAGVPELLIAREELQRLIDVAWHELSDLERRGVFGFAIGYSYGEIEGCADGEQPKKVDNAIQRGRAKLRAAA